MLDQQLSKIYTAAVSIFTLASYYIFILTALCWLYRINFDIFCFFGCIKLSGGLFVKKVFARLCMRPVFGKTFIQNVKV